MKISIGTNIKEGPWGGGNLFAINLKEFLILNGHSVVNNLHDNDIDIILITEPRKTSESSAFTHLDVKDYVNFVNKESLIVHRLNECDERKGTNFVNKYLIEANKVSDCTIFVSTWLKNLYLNQGINKKNNNVILAGANQEIFNSKGKVSFKKDEKLKIVTHHWGANWNKGFSIYEKIDNLLFDKNWNEKIEFTYIGNLPNKFKFKNSNYVKPLSGEILSNELKKNHVYLTGSLNEPSGNHHIEGAQCGLPVMYIDSGGVKEYCKDYGVEYTQENLEEKIDYVLKNYNNLSSKMKDYPFNSNVMNNEYLKLFNKMMENKESILMERSINKPGYIEEKIFNLKKIFDL